MKKISTIFAWLLLAGCSGHMHGCGHDFDFGYVDETAEQKQHANASSPSETNS